MAKTTTTTGIETATTTVESEVKNNQDKSKFLALYQRVKTPNL